jgi:putative endonuclease
MRSFWVYILRCSDGTFYVGLTIDVESRIADHQAGVFPTAYTFKRRPVRLVHVEEFDSVCDAITRERQLKRWTRAKKEALVKDDETLLFRLSKRAHLRGL